jgi:hypothetical protein
LIRISNGTATLLFWRAITHDASSHSAALRGQRTPAACAA